MRANATIFWILAVFFLALGAVYTLWTYWDSGWVRPEWVGTVALPLSAIFAAFLAFYIGRTGAAVGGTLPEDRLDADIDDGDPEIGEFSPWSWWPILLAAASCLVFLGLAVGVWISFIGVPILVLALVGWNYEHYRGNFVR